MPYIFPIERNQIRMFNTLEEQIEENNPIRIIDSIVDSILKDNRDMIELDDETGRPRYQDNTMLKILLYAYLHRVRSSRSIERECRLNRELIWLTGELAPDHWTIAKYRVNGKEKIKKLTQLFRRFLAEHGYVKSKLMAIDGTKVKANAKRDMLSREKLLGRLSKLDKEMETYLEELKTADAIEDTEEQTGAPINQNNNQLMKQLEESANEIARLNQMLDKMKETEKNFVSVSDWDANMMRTRNGKMAAYNVQLVVDAENKMIADSEVVTQNTDTFMVGEMLHSTEEELGVVPETVVMDNGYMKPDAIEKAEKEFIEAGTPINIVVAGQEKPQEDIKLVYNAEEDVYYCSENQPLKLAVKNKLRREARADVYQGVACQGCKRREECTKAKNGRIHHRYHNQQWRDEYEKKIRQPESIALIKQRKTLSEHPNGTIKWMMGYAQFVLRGLEKVTIEIDLLTTCYNLKRLINISSFESIMAQIRGYRWQIE